MRTSIFQLLFIVNTIFLAQGHFFTLKRPIKITVLTSEDGIHKNTVLIVGRILSPVSHEAQDRVYKDAACSTLPLDISACINEKKCPGTLPFIYKQVLRYNYKVQCICFVVQESGILAHNQAIIHWTKGFTPTSVSPIVQTWGVLILQGQTFLLAQPVLKVKWFRN